MLILNQSTGVIETWTHLDMLKEVNCCLPEPRPYDFNNYMALWDTYAEGVRYTRHVPTMKDRFLQGLPLIPDMSC